MQPERFICRTCAVQCDSYEREPEQCQICTDERQYVGHQGQQWATLSQLKAEGYQNDIREIEPGLAGIDTRPRFGIGQRALLVQTDAGNVLWDCLGYIDDATVEQISTLGGITAISASHPHFYGSMLEYSHAFDNAPVYVPDADKEWIIRPDPAIQLWQDSVELLPGVTLIQCGGHFPGSAVIHWEAGAEGRGALLTGDTIAVVQDRDFVSFMWSYPNLIPLPDSEVRRVADAVRPYTFDRIYGGWWGRNVMSGAKDSVRRSAERYISQIREN